MKTSSKPLKKMDSSSYGLVAFPLKMAPFGMQAVKHQIPLEMLLGHVQPSKGSGLHNGLESIEASLSVLQVAKRSFHEDLCFLQASQATTASSILS
jgi:hypothetical protein